MASLATGLKCVMFVERSLTDHLGVPYIYVYVLRTQSVSFSDNKGRVIRTRTMLILIQNSTTFLHLIVD